MFDICPQCGLRNPQCKVNRLKGKDAIAICPNCSYEKQFLMLPLFILLGASTSGKSTVYLNLVGKQSLALPVEGDILWRREFDTPENGYHEFRELWLRVCKHISQGGKPMFLTQCGEPIMFEACVERRYFSKLHYLALVCDEDVLKERLVARQKQQNYTNKKFIADHIEYNRWIKENDNQTQPRIDIIDTTSASVEDTVEGVIEWLKGKLEDRL